MLRRESRGVVIGGEWVLGPLTPLCFAQDEREMRGSGLW